MKPRAVHPRLSWLAALGMRSVAVAVLLATVVAVLLNPMFVTPFPVVLGRTLFLAIVLLLVYGAAGQWPAARLPHWLPRWLAQVLAVALAAPLATLAVYLLAVGGDVAAFVNTPGRVAGFGLIAGSGLVLGIVLALGALVRERERESHTQALQFALERERLERQALDARLTLLQAQVEPHFLFNTLANVQALVEGGSPRAAELLRSLIAYLRAATARLHDGTPTLGQEMTLVRAYLELMQMRMPDRLEFALRESPALAERPFPPLALLTLVENAVRHGIDPCEDGGRIEVGAAADADGGWRVWVSDTGVGMAASAPPGTGLQNLRERLQVTYGGAARLAFKPVVPRGLRAELWLPPR